MTTLRLTKSIGRSPLRLAFLLLPLLLVCFALSPQARAVCQQGCDLTNGNTFLGDDALVNNTTGVDNTATGSNALFNNTTGGGNTVNGFNALFSNTGGNQNTANGFYALFSNSTGGGNTATGDYSLYNNTTGPDNTANGDFALFSNTTGGYNTANGGFALSENTTGQENTAAGYLALHFNTIGKFNTANGFDALSSNTGGNFSTADGAAALFKNTTGLANVAIGYNALFNNTSGGFNTALGQSAGSRLTTGNSNIDIGNSGLAAEANTIRIGTTGTQTNAYVAGISGVTVAGGVGVIVDTNGHLGTVVSSERFKDAIKPMDKASEAILSLQPVTFHYKKDLDPAGIPQFGLVAEQVEKLNPDLVARDDQGKPYTVRYEAVNAMLLNEFLKEHRKVEEQEATITELKKHFRATVAQLTTRLDEQAAQIRKVSAPLEAGKPSPQVVKNP